MLWAQRFTDRFSINRIKSQSADAEIIWYVHQKNSREAAAGKRWCQELVRALVLEWVVHSFNLLPAKRNSKDEWINQSKCVEWFGRGERKRSDRWGCLRCGLPMCSLVRTRRSFDSLPVPHLWDGRIHEVSMRWGLDEHMMNIYIWMPVADYSSVGVVRSLFLISQD